MVQEKRASLRVLDTLRQRLKAAASRGAIFTGVLYGLHLEGERLVVGATGKEGGGDMTVDLTQGSHMVARSRPSLVVQQSSPGPRRERLEPERLNFTP